MTRSGVLIAAAVLFLLLAGCGDVQAQGPVVWGWSGQGWYLAPSRDQLQKLPHFALFPPVYYSYPVRRTYGYSPFASLPEYAISETTRVQLAEMRQVEPLLIRNPFVPGQFPPPKRAKPPQPAKPQPAKASQPEKPLQK
jgi:hypothetical protein